MIDQGWLVPPGNGEAGSNLIYETKLPASTYGRVGSEGNKHMAVAVVGFPDPLPPLPPRQKRRAPALGMESQGVPGTAEMWVLTSELSPNWMPQIVISLQNCGRQDYALQVGDAMIFLGNVISPREGPDHLARSPWFTNVPWVQSFQSPLLSPPRTASSVSQLPFLQRWAQPDFAPHRQGMSPVLLLAGTALWGSSWLPPT